MNMTVSIIVWLCAIAVAVLYLKSGGQKFKNPYALQLVMGEYIKLPPIVSRFSASAITMIELLIAIWIIIPITQKAGAWSGAILQCFFIVLMFKNLGRTLEQGCGCFGLNQPQKITIKHIYMNLSILIALIGVIILG